MANSRLGRRQKRRARKWVKVTLFTILSIFIILLCFGGYIFYKAYSAAKESYTPIHRPGNKSALRKKAPTIGQDPISILLMGVEKYSTHGKNGRADTEIVVTLNPKTHQMTMVSVPRDTRVYLDKVPKYAGYGKINSAYTYGAISGYGANKYQVQEVEKLLNVPIDKFVAVDFKGFTDIVKALGGVTVNVKYPFWEYNFFHHGQKFYYHKGPMHLNGPQALAFVRMRDRPIDVTYTRMDRQRQFIKAAIKQALQVGTIFKVGEITNILGKHVQTNLKPADIYTLEQEYSHMKPSSIHTIKIQGVNKKIPANTGLYYFIPNQQSLKQVSRELRKSLDMPVSSSKSSSTTSSSTNGSGNNNSTNSTGSNSTTSTSTGN